MQGISPVGPPDQPDDGEPSRMVTSPKHFSMAQPIEMVRRLTWPDPLPGALAPAGKHGCVLFVLRICPADTIETNFNLARHFAATAARQKGVTGRGGWG
jgi:hypothetical protein